MKKLVIIPTYKEKENIQLIIDAVINLGQQDHLLIIDDNSPDGTADIVKSMQQLHPNELFLIQRAGKLGLGTAYIAGFQWALANGYEYIFEMDADFSHDPKDLERLYEACHTGGADMAVGSRYVCGGQIENWPLSRKLISKAGALYSKLITWLPVNDATAGFVCYSRKVLATMDLKSIRFIGYAFQIEMKFTAWKCGFAIKEVPIIFYDRTEGQSKMSGKIFREAVLGVIEMKIKSWFRRFPQAKSA